MLVLALVVCAGLAMPVCDIRAYGAVPDGSKSTAAIQAAVDDCSARGGGRVLVEGGTFATGSVQLRSFIELHVAPGATLLGVNSTDSALDYPARTPPSNNTQLSDARRALIYAEGAEWVSIRGGGTIDGNGGCSQWVGDVPASERPILVFFVQTNHSLVEGVALRNSAMWGLVHLESDHVVVRDCAIDTLRPVNRDGTDVVDCHDVLIENVAIRSEDDSVCLKSGAARGVRDVLVRNVTVLQSAAGSGLKLGTASLGGFWNVTFEDVRLANIEKAAMAVESVDGAAVQNIVFRRIRFDNVGAAFFVVLGQRGPRAGSVSGVAFADVVGNQTKRNWGSIVTGTLPPGAAPQELHLISFANVSVACAGGLSYVPREPAEYGGQYPEVTNWGPLPAFGVYFRHIRGLNLTACAAQLVPGETDPREGIEFVDVHD